MRILIVTQVLDCKHPILGFFHRWVEEFAHNSEKVVVVCLFKGEHTLPPNVEVLSLGKETGESRVKYLLNFYRYVLPLIFTKKIDRIFIHMNEVYIWLLLPFYPLIRGFGIRYIWWKAHGHLRKSVRFLRFFVDRVATSSEEGFPIKTRKRVVVGQGIDTKFFHPENTNQREHIVAVGRIDPVKHFDDLIEALPRVVQDGHRPIVTLVGKVSEEHRTYFDNVRQRVEDLGLKDSVRFLPPVAHDTLAELYRVSGIMVNPSDTDSMDKVVLEAMACEVVPVASNLAYKPILEPFGLYLPKRDTETLAAILERLLTMSDDEFRVLQTEMRAIVVKNHTIEGLIERLSIL